MKPGLIFQHTETAPPGRVGEWLRERGHPFVVHRVWEASPPDPTEFGFVVSLGSEQSATARYPAWVPSEIATLRKAAAKDIPILGLCFGGQALSVALGGGIRLLPTPQVGWSRIKSFDEAVPTGPWLHFHEEVMQLPPGARELARTRLGPAAFRKGPHVGVQFHPDADNCLAELWLHLHLEMAEGALAARSLTSEDYIAQTATYAANAREQAFRLFDGWLASALAR